jgi:hypothetical protein
MNKTTSSVPLRGVDALPMALRPMSSPLVLLDVLPLICSRPGVRGMAPPLLLPAPDCRCDAAVDGCCAAPDDDTVVRIARQGLVPTCFQRALLSLATDNSVRPPPLLSAMRPLRMPTALFMRAKRPCDGLGGCGSRFSCGMQCTAPKFSAPH